MACVSSTHSARTLLPARAGVCPQAPKSRAVIARATDTPDPAASIKAIEATDENFRSLVLENPLPVLVDFWAPWCGPCRMLAPIVDEIADSMEGQLVCVKLNTDDSPGVATEYGIRSIPTIMLFKGGKRLDTIIGAVPKDNLLKTINKITS